MTPKPAVLTWFYVYTVLMALTYALAIVLGIVLLVVDPDTLGLDDPSFRDQDRVLTAWMWIVMGIPFMAAYAAPLFLPRQKWAWTYDLVVICLGLISCCCLPVCIPLLIFWLKPEAKAWFDTEEQVPEDAWGA